MFGSRPENEQPANEKLNSMFTLIGPEYGAEIQAHPNGKWLYVSNRGTGPMLLYHIDQETGLLTSKPVRIQ